MGWPKGRKLSPEAKAWLSVSRMGSGNTFYGRKHTKETRRRMSESKLGPKNNRYGVRHTDEARTKMSMNRKGKYKGSTHWNYGRRMSEETKDKLRRSLRERGVY